MSAQAEIAVLAPSGAGRHDASARPVTEDRPLLRLGTFAALALYGTLRWGTLMSPAPTWRLLGLFGLAVMLAGAGMLLGQRSRLAVGVLAVLCILLAFALAGVPLSWVRHFRIAVTANGISQGLSGLPRVLLPYVGANEWIRTVIMLGAAVLLLDSALIVGLGSRHGGEGRRAAAAIGLVALAVVPSTLMRPSLPYIQGLLLFALLAAFMWADRIRRDDRHAAIVVAGLAAVAAMLTAPALDTHTPWLNYQQLASNLAPKHPEAFNWAQQYGPLTWPRTGRRVLEVQARQAQYWKTEDLDGFVGGGWVGLTNSTPDPVNTIAPSALHEWTENVHVTLQAMSTDDVITAGTAAQPADLPGVASGLSDGTWVDPGGLGPGDSYELRAYDPTPSPAQLAAAGSNYPAALWPGYLTITVPLQLSGVGSAPGGLNRPLSFAAFGSQPPVNYGPALADSPYGGAYALSQQLLRGAPTPYAYVEAVKRYLDSGRYVYSLNPPRSGYPIVTFLFDHRAGYCQQFAGAMALLLRMGGVPARVAVGFTPGTYDGNTHSWAVTDLDAHAWVEAWFPSYGWVRFDPTPVAPAGQPLLPTPKGAGAGASSGSSGHAGSAASAPSSTAGGKPSGAVSPLPIVAAVAAVLLVLLLARAIRFRAPTGEQLLAELERAFARSGRRLAAGTTLATLEDRLDGSPRAQGYVRALRLSRFAGQSVQPSRAERRALRRQLRTGPRIVGVPRALWALPPRWHVHLPASGHSARGIHST